MLRYVGALKGRMAGGRSGASGGDEDNYTSDKVIHRGKYSDMLHKLLEILPKGTIHRHNCFFALELPFL